MNFNNVEEGIEYKYNLLAIDELRLLRSCNLSALYIQPGYADYK